MSPLLAPNPDEVILVSLTGSGFEADEQVLDLRRFWI
jgi:hypothetical protein